MPGRPTKLTPETQAKICEALRAGNYFDTACAYAGISVSTGYEWIQRGKGEHPTKKGGKPFSDFSDAIEKASADAETQSVALIMKAGTETWTARAWWLERRFPDKWGRQRIDLNVQLTLIQDTIKALQAAGHNPEQVFRDLIEAARERANEQSTTGTAGAQVPDGTSD